MTFALVLAVSVPFVLALLARPAVRRLATRSMARRPVELVLVVAGSMLATAILTGSILVGDTVDRSIRSTAYEQLGPIDELVAVSGLDDAQRLWSSFDGFESDQVDGVLDMTTAGAAAVGMGEDQLAQPTAQLVEVDFADAAAFGGDPGATGITGDTPTEGRAAITEDLADKVEVGVGDTVIAYAYGATTELVVDRILPRTGVAGFWQAPGQRSYNLFVAPGTIAALAAGAASDTEPPRGFVAVSNLGGVEDGASRTDEVTAQLEQELGDVSAVVRPVKETVLDTAESVGASLGDLYFTIGMFAVVAGILLLVNIFVMLADERRHELGVMRAIGLRRGPMVTQFASEGWIYALVSAAIGALVGIGVGWVIAWRSAQILSSGREVDSLRIEFAFDWASVVAGFALGFLISLLTIVVTSVRIARLNVIGAIRELPDAKPRRARRRVGVAGAVLAVLGVAWTYVGFSQKDAYGILLGPELVVVGLALPAIRIWRGGVVLSTAATLVLVWAIVAIPLLGVVEINLDIPVFLAQGLSLVSAAVVIATVHQATVARALTRLTGGSLPVRIGLAYPLARSLRTALTLAMVSIVVLTLTYISVISAMVEGNGDDTTAELSGGYDIVVQSNPANPVPLADLDAADGVTAVAPLGYAGVDFTFGDDDPVTWPVSGFDETLLSAPPTLRDTGSYDSESAAWSAVLADPDLLIADEFFLITDAGPPAETIDVGDVVTMRDPLSGTEREVTVAAMAAPDMTRNGVWYGIDGLESLTGERVPLSRFLVAADDPEAVARELSAAFVANGTEAETIRSSVEIALALNSAFFTLMQQFVGAGLVVGMAGIGVIMVRAVRERRREIGVLRSLGYPTGAVARTFVVEATFVAVEGVVIGVGTALIASRGLATSGVSWAEGLEWSVPFGEIAVIVGLTLGAALVAAVWPARSAARTRPAAALRLAE